MGTMLVAAALLQVGALAPDTTRELQVETVDQDGYVVDGAVIELDGLGITMVTGAAGRADATVPIADEYVLHISHVAYASRTDTIRVLPTRDEAFMRITMVQEAIPLPPIEVTVAGRTSQIPALQGFHERMRTGTGYYLSREDMEQVQYRVTDAFRRVPGMDVYCGQANICSVRFSRALGSGPDSDCAPQYFVDGAPLYLQSLDEMFRPQDIEGIEIYNLANLPARFWRPDGRSRCGTIVVWTRYR